VIRNFILEFVIVIVYMSGWFLAAIRQRRNDVADVAWGFGFLLVAATSLLLQSVTGPVAGRPVLVTALVAVWGIRLSLHIHLRNRGKTEDFRYRNWREEWGTRVISRSYLQVFLLQGILLVLISTPVIYINGATNPPLGYADIAGVLVWAAGFLFEAIGDFQLRHFARNPVNKGRIIESGLWRFSRHPNYFGEVLLWWGIYLIALAVPAAWWTVIGPTTITYLILQVSGIPMLEAKYRGNPEYEAYQRRTSSFFPLPPRL
jgi:steroid 5-alpha reductase family enzyme